jgi:ligand-binding SRPBCC domain-containing protein
MAKHFHRPYLPFSPKKMVAIALGEFSSVLFASQKVISKKLNENNFNFQFTDIKSVLENHYPSGSESYLYSDQFIEKPITDVFNFFSDEKNLEAITPPWLNFKVLNKSTKTMQEGTLINYELKIRGVLVKWQTKILEWKPTSHFIDAQLKGPYKIWHHTHEFIEVQGGTFMTDIVKYEIPYGIFGSLAKLLFVKNDVEKIFNYRFLKIKELFSTLS